MSKYFAKCCQNMLNLPKFIKDSATVIFQECDYEGVRGGGVGGGGGGGGGGQ